MLSQPRPSSGVRNGALVLTEVDGEVVAGIVMDDNTWNPIRLVSAKGQIFGLFAEDLELVDREMFELTIYLEGTRRDGSRDIDAASDAASM